MATYTQNSDGSITKTLANGREFNVNTKDPKYASIVKEAGSALKTTSSSSSSKPKSTTNTSTASTTPAVKDGLYKNANGSYTRYVNGHPYDVGLNDTRYASIDAEYKALNPYEPDKPLYTAEDLVEKYPVEYDFNNIRGIFEDNVAANYDALRDKYAATEAALNSNVYALQQSLSKTLQDTNSQATATEASTGVTNANLVSALLGTSQQSTDYLTQVAQGKAALDSEEAAAQYAAVKAALETANSAGLSLGNLANNIYMTDAQYYAAKQGAKSTDKASQLNYNANADSVSAALEQARIAAEADKYASQFYGSGSGSSSSGSSGSSGSSTPQRTLTAIVQDYFNAGKEADAFAALKANGYSDDGAKKYIENLKKEAKAKRAKEQYEAKISGAGLSTTDKNVVNAAVAAAKAAKAAGGNKGAIMSAADSVWRKANGSKEAWSQINREVIKIDD